MYGATFDTAYLTRAVKLANFLLEFFFDQGHGGFYPYASDGEQLLTRAKDAYDGAMPSGNSVAALTPFTKDYPIPAQGARYYLCRGGACAQPVDSIPELKTLLHSWAEPKP